jgi:hypothetical protein
MCFVASFGAVTATHNSLEFLILTMPGNLHIDGDSGGKFIILGGDSISHCEKESSCEHVFNCEWLPKYSCLNLQT